MEYIDIKYIKVDQPIGSFYIGAINWSSLLKIASADIRKIHEEENKGDNFDSYLGIQRKVSPSRIKEIGQYVSTIDATFPTSIILSINSKTKLIDDKPIDELDDSDFVHDNFDKIKEINNIIIEGDILKIRKNPKVARILDGQHRIEGLRDGFDLLKENNQELPDFEFNVTIFVDLDLDDQAQVFSVINKAQTKVNKSLVYDLYDYAKSRSPQKTAHDIVRLLNKLNESPFYKKIKILGTAENKELETIAQATLAELIINYISKDPMADRDILKRKLLFGNRKLELASESELKRRIFRNLFIKEKDEEIFNIILIFFKAISDKWSKAWNDNSKGSGNILNKSTGIIAFMRFLGPLYNHIISSNLPLNEDTFNDILGNIDLVDSDFNKDNYIPGSSGQSKLYYDLVNKSKIEL